MNDQLEKLEVIRRVLGGIGPAADGAVAALGLLMKAFQHED
jgi:hypothetical protein